MFALVDCNNFFASCERIFNPALNNKPVVVLSNNDGCIISRSYEAKKLGVPMGGALHEYKHLLQQHNAAIFSANFALYGDISSRVMAILETCVDDIEIYSIDEAFLDLSGYTDLDLLGAYIREKILKWVGVPVSVGIAPTKTLAKLANKIAKKSESGVYIIRDLAQFKKNILSKTPVQDIWGIGGRSARALSGYGIWTAADLASADDRWIRKKLTIKGLQTAWELRGISCLKLEEVTESQKSIIYSRSFGQRITSLVHLKQAVAEYVTRAASRLRLKALTVSAVTVYVATSKFAQERYAQSVTFTLPVATDYTPLLINHAIKALEHIYVQGYEYKKAGVIFFDLVPKNEKQKTLFYKPLINETISDDLMKTVDAINNKWGTSTISFAASGIEKNWQAKRERKSSAYTTSWDEILTIKI
ncbi:MAG: Y-family DNA polymerase [Candidatus Babeliaceae bacterium]|nr:Y-family DNA polymerase [Candidatus Babeliaceae bacterium]